MANECTTKFINFGGLKPLSTMGKNNWHNKFLSEIIAVDCDPPNVTSHMQ